MFLSTNSKGVKRLSLLAGFVAAGYGISYHEPTFYSGRGPHWDVVLINLTNFALWAGSFFVVAWVGVRVIAWVVAGFSEDRKQG